MSWYPGWSYLCPWWEVIAIAPSSFYSAGMLSTEMLAESWIPPRTTCPRSHWKFFSEHGTNSGVITLKTSPRPNSFSFDFLLCLWQLPLLLTFCSKPRATFGEGHLAALNMPPPDPSPTRPKLLLPMPGEKIRTLIEAGLNSTSFLGSGSAGLGAGLGSSFLGSAFLGSGFFGGMLVCWWAALERERRRQTGRQGRRDKSPARTGLYPCPLSWSHTLCHSQTRHMSELTIGPLL